MNDAKRRKLLVTVGVDLQEGKERERERENGKCDGKSWGRKREEWE